MNMLMSHMADYLQLEGYKKTEGNEAQAKKSLGCEVMTDVSPGESELLLAEKKRLARDGESRSWDDLRTLWTSRFYNTICCWPHVTDRETRGSHYITRGLYNPKFIGQDYYFVRQAKAPGMIYKINLIIPISIVSSLVGTWQILLAYVQRGTTQPMKATLVVYGRVFSWYVFFICEITHNHMYINYNHIINIIYIYNNHVIYIYICTYYNYSNASCSMSFDDLFIQLLCRNLLTPRGFSKFVPA